MARYLTVQLDDSTDAALSELQAKYPADSVEILTVAALNLWAQLERAGWQFDWEYYDATYTVKRPKRVAKPGG